MHTLSVLFSVSLLLGGCGSQLTSQQGGSDTGFVDTTDTEPPVIEHVAVSDAQLLGDDVDISAVVTDEGSGVFLVKLYYKNETGGSGDWESDAMVMLGDNEWVGTIPGEMQASGGVNYYIEALDNSGNAADSPEKGADDPWHFRLYE